MGRGLILITGKKNYININACLLGYIFTSVIHKLIYNHCIISCLLSCLNGISAQSTSQFSGYCVTDRLIKFSNGDGNRIETTIAN